MRLDPASAETEMIRKTADFTGMTVLEIGSGDGRMTSLISSQAAMVLSIDTDYELIAKAGQGDVPPNVQYSVGDICTFDVVSHSFDAAFLALSL